MTTTKLCDNCRYAKNHESVSHPGGEYIRLDCHAPIPGYLPTFGDEGKGIGHKAAQFCALHSSKAESA